MVPGVRARGEDGSIIFEYTDRLFKFLGVAQVGQGYTGDAPTGTIQHGLFNAYPGNFPVAFVIAGRIEPNGEGVEFSFSGDILTWTFPKSGAPGVGYTRPDTIFTYGIW